ncbi:uncharacterized protein [Triticum aestivum]|uniref:uncharacterized protein n=1 Tax=Triticum aestivum TaxID=4565 RepID=UPI001D01D22E|nr:uncharacterized protein LOC123049345 [Triticum aestivum]
MVPSLTCGRGLCDVRVSLRGAATASRASGMPRLLARFAHSLSSSFPPYCSLCSSPRFVPFERLHHGHPFLHGCCWLSLPGFHVGSFVGVWVIQSLLSRLFHLLLISCTISV